MIQLVSGYALSYSLLRTVTSGYFPDGRIITSIVVLIILLLISTLLSSFESAYLSVTQDDIDKLRTGRRSNSSILLRLFSGTDRLPGTLYLTNLILNIIIILLAAVPVTMIIDPATCRFGCFLAAGLIILFLILFFNRVLPGLFTPDLNLSLALFMAPAVAILDIITGPLASFLKIDHSVPRKRSGTLRQGITRDGLSEALDQNSDDFDDDEMILEGIENFGNTNVSTIMCPRIDVTSIDIRSGLNQVIKLIISSGFSRIPAYSETFDNVKGILYAKDILPFMSNPDNFKWQSLLREPYFVPETKKISELLKEFQIKKIHMAVVIDEYGGSAGIVTLEDILE
jgi:putative hemolysin